MAEPDWSMRTTLKCDFIAINDEADVQRMDMKLLVYNSQ